MLTNTITVIRSTGELNGSAHQHAGMASAKMKSLVMPSAVCGSPMACGSYIARMAIISSLMRLVAYNL